MRRNGVPAGYFDGDGLTATLDYQRREIMNAKSQKSDLDFAFNLQMQEALTASVAGSGADNSSSSRSLIGSPPPNGVVKDDDFDYLSLLLEDISRYDVERGDRERCEEEMRRLRENLSTRIHDQKVAADLMNIPEEEWARTGDHFQKPFNGGGDQLQGETFKLYVKGIVSEERMRDMKVMAAGAGVAICDFKDNVVMETNKALEGAENMNGERAEIEALIHGLSAASSLELKRIMIYCDDYMVFQYVTRRVQANQSTTATLLNKVSVLAKKFTDCQITLIARNDLKYAIKLARDAIVSQIRWPDSKGNSKNLKETCVICFEDVDAGRMFTIDGCFHRYCFSCMKQHVEVKLLNGLLAKCPDEGCKSEVSIQSCRKFLDPKLVDIMENRMLEKSIPVEDKVYCPFSTCSALMSKQEVLKYTKTFFANVEGCGARRCLKCHRYFCMHCKAQWHYGMSCYDNRIRNGPPKEDKLLNTLAKQKLWRQCAKCFHMIELKEGCYHITCRCGYEFCYTCGAEWKNKRPTCRCQIWDERNIIRN